MIGGMQGHMASEGHATLIENVEKRVREESFAEIGRLKDRISELESTLRIASNLLPAEAKESINGVLYKKP